MANNLYLIESAKFDLWKQGILKRKDSGEIETIHTATMWKHLGYLIIPQEKHRCRITIWKHGKSKIDKETGEIKAGRMFLKSACFFTEEQVLPLAEWVEIYGRK